MNDGLDGQTMTSHGDGSTNSAGGHLESPLFTRLPVELRLQIYQDVFHGSTAQSNYFPWHGPAADRCGWCHPKYMYQLRHSGHHRLLLTCHAVYKEATALYWSSTIINMGQERGPDYDPWWPGRGWSPSIGDSVCAIPAYARQYIQHITNVSRPEGIDANIKGWWLAKGISYLPSLKTCRLRDVIQMGPDEHNIIGNNLKNKDQVGRDEFIIDFCVDNADVGPRLHAPFEEPLFEEPFFAAVIVQKYRIKHTDPEARYCPDTASDQVQTGFIQVGTSPSYARSFANTRSGRFHQPYHSTYLPHDCGLEGREHE